MRRQLGQNGSLLPNSALRSPVRANIYESIVAPQRRPSSLSTSRLNELAQNQVAGREEEEEEAERLLQDDTDHWTEHQNCSLGRRDQNANDGCEQITSRQSEEDNGQLLDRRSNDGGRSSNQYSEIRTGQALRSAMNQAAEIGRESCCDNSHYQVPISAATVSEELNQLIEAKRKRTLMLLRAKEAPRASFELTSPLDSEAAGSVEMAMPGGGPEQDASSIVSHYENVGGAGDLRPEQHQVVAQVPNEVMSPSDSTTLNTLSIVSDALGELSQENSLVQQLGGAN